MSEPSCCARSRSCSPKKVPAKRRRRRRIRTDSARSPASIPFRKPTPSPPSPSTWTTGAGPACPFFIRTGKKLPKRVHRHRHSIQLRAAHPVRLDGDGELSKRPNLLILRIQPEEGISLRFFSKQPGSGMHLRPVSMDFKYGASFGGRSPSAYETLLVDAMVGDATLYTRQDMVEASWKVVEPIMEDWQSQHLQISRITKPAPGVLPQPMPCWREPVMFGEIVDDGRDASNPAKFSVS